MGELIHNGTMLSEGEMWEGSQQEDGSSESQGD